MLASVSGLRHKYPTPYLSDSGVTSHNIHFPEDMCIRPPHIFLAMGVRDIDVGLLHRDMPIFSNLSDIHNHSRHSYFRQSPCILVS